MTPFDRFAAEVSTLSRTAARLETIERRHRVLAAGFAHLERRITRDHDLGQPAGASIARLSRLDRWMTRAETEALTLVNAVLPLVRTEPDRG